MESAIHGPATKKARETRKLSQTEVATAIGLNRVYYSLFEAGRYVLDSDERARLSEFLRGQGIQRSEVTAGPPVDDRVEVVAEHGPVRRSEYDRDDIDPRLAAASSALQDLRDVVELSGIDSKRTAGLVSAAIVALQALDYVELLDASEKADMQIEGLPSPDEFSVLPLAQKELWEGRAAGVLVCQAMYGDDWQRAKCKDFERVAAGIRDGVPDGEWNVRERSLFESLFDEAENFGPRYRCDLAPHIAKAGTERRAPTLLSNQMRRVR